MPHRIKRPAPRTSKQRKLLQALIDELRSPQTSGQPIITEEHVGKSGAVQVRVLWDRWQDCPHAQRSELIREAFERVKGEDFAKQIRLAVGVSFPEAKAIGYLPYLVIPVHSQGDPASPEQYRRAMIEEGASTLENVRAPLLGFESLEEAQDCVRRLEQRVPGSHWTIVQEMGT